MGSPSTEERMAHCLSGYNVLWIFGNFLSRAHCGVRHNQSSRLCRLAGFANHLFLLEHYPNVLICKGSINGDKMVRSNTHPRNQPFGTSHSERRREENRNHGRVRSVLRFFSIQSGQQLRRRLTPVLWVRYLCQCIHCHSPDTSLSLRTWLQWLQTVRLFR